MLPLPQHACEEVQAKVSHAPQFAQVHGGMAQSPAR